MTKLTEVKMDYEYVIEPLAQLFKTELNKDLEEKCK